MHLLQCVEEMRNAFQMQQQAKKSQWLTHIEKLWTHAHNNKKLSIIRVFRNR
jgi:hypothetical protein